MGNPKIVKMRTRKSKRQELLTVIRCMQNKIKGVLVRE